MAPPITRREQNELDELLSDIYRGIEALPDKSPRQVTTTAYDISSPTQQATNHHYQQQQQQQHYRDTASKAPPISGRVYVKEYELSESDPLVQRHKQEIAALRGDRTGGGAYTDTSNTRPQQPGRSTLKRHTTPLSSSYASNSEQQQQQQPQSLASFITQPQRNLSRPSTTPEGKRRVRIVDPNLAVASGSADGESKEGGGRRDNNNYRITGGGGGKPALSGKPEKVKYVNTNKFIYHQERDPEDTENYASEYYDYDTTPTTTADINNNNNNNHHHNDYDDDDIDGVTRVEYYHTSWLDKQLGRASKRRSSKELNERQVKEKAMIEELKRSLKNGAITLRQSFKGKRNTSKQQNTSELYDDDNNNNDNQFLNDTNYNLSNTNTKQHYPNKRVKDSSVINSGLATLPRNYHDNKQQVKSGASRQPQQQQSLNNPYNNLPTTTANKHKLNWSKGSYYKEPVESNTDLDPYYQPTPKQTTQQLGGQYSQPAIGAKLEPKQQQQQPNYSSKTLPHNKHLSSSTGGKHQLLQSHYRGQQHWGTATPIPQQQQQQQQQQLNYPNTLEPKQSSTNQQEMKHPAYNSPNCASPNSAANHGFKNTNQPPPSTPTSQRLQQHQHQQASTISGIPSATEVVRSALSRSSSQVSLNQLNKTINLLPNSPPPFSPMTPTQQLKAASPTLSPSPDVRSTPCSTDQQHKHLHQYSSKTLGHQPSSTIGSNHHHHHHHHHQQQQQQQYLPGQIVLHGTRTVGRPPQQQPQQTPTTLGSQQQQQQPQQQQQLQQQQRPIYANPHASLMQHRMEQQMRQPNKNVASIREFNELDSLLRSLGPSSATTSTHITPGYTSRPGQPSIGGYMPSGQQQQQQPTARPNVPDIYARVQKQQQPEQQTRPLQQTAGGYRQPSSSGPGVAFNPQPQQQLQPYVIDVTDNRADENCLQRQELSEFEPPIDLLPSMEDYQNITKLNPVKNHYWYKPFMSRDKAINLLKDKPQGTFIVRDSTSHKGAFGLAVKVSKLPKNVLNNASLRSSNGDPSAEFIRHFLIEPAGAGVRLSGYKEEPVFDNLPDLIYQHSLTQIALPCRLVIPRADIEDSMFNQKQKQFVDDFIASKEQAKSMPYERTSPDGGYRRYPGDVYVHNEHRIIFE